MSIVHKMWPWSRIADLESQLRECKANAEFSRLAHSKACDQLEKLQKTHEQSLKEHTASREGLRKMAEILKMRGFDRIFPLLLLLVCFSASSQSIIRNNVTTNALGAAASNTKLLNSISAVPTWGVDATDFTNEVTRQSWHQPTNAWTGTSFLLGQRSIFVGSTNVYLLTCTTVGTTDATWGILTLRATGDITVTNHPSFKASDFAVSRVCTNGNTMALIVDMEPGQFTNLSVVQFK